MSGPGDDIDDRTGLAILDKTESVALLESTPIGRVVFVDEDNQPIAVPVNFRWVDESVVFRTIEGQKLQAAVLGQAVTFEVDRFDETLHTGASVLVKGTGVHVTNWAEKEQLEQLGITPWSHHPWRQAWIRIIPETITGRRLVSQ